MISRNISVFVTGGTKKITLNEPFLTSNNTTIQLEQATVFWNFQNVTLTSCKYNFGSEKDGNKEADKFLPPGYWDFELIRERLKEDKINITPTIYNNKCIVENTNNKTLNLGTLGKLLGYPQNEVILSNGSLESPQVVDVNRKLKYLTIACDLANPTQNVDSDGNTSTNIAHLPIPPGTRLNSSVSSFNGNYPLISLKEDIVTEMTFTVTSNISIPVNVDVLLNLVVNGIHI